MLETGKAQYNKDFRKLAAVAVELFDGTQGSKGTYGVAEGRRVPEKVPENSDLEIRFAGVDPLMRTVPGERAVWLPDDANRGKLAAGVQYAGESWLNRECRPVVYSAYPGRRR